MSHVIGPDLGPSAELKRASPYAWYVLLVMFIVYAFSLLDRQILVILAQQIKADLSLDDTQLGYLYGTAFGIFYTLFGIPLGRLADRSHRIFIMAIGLVIWSSMTTLSGLATSFGMLALARIGVGVGEASASPAAYSILGATFPKNQRALAISLYSAGSFVGTGLSLPVGGFLSDNWNTMYAAGGAPFGLVGWQIAFLAVGLPGFLIALWVLSLREPPREDHNSIEQRGSGHGFITDLMAILPPFTLWVAARHPGGLRANVKALALIAAAAVALTYLTGDVGQWVTTAIGAYAIASWLQAIRYTDPPAFELIWRRRTVMILSLAFGLQCVTYNAFGLWASPYAIRTFHVSASEVGALIGIPGAIAAVIGTIVAGSLADWWKKRDPRGRIFVCMLSGGAPIPLMIFMFTRPDLQTYLLVSPLVYFFLSGLVGAGVTALQDLVLPRMFATLGAIFLVSSNMIGLSIGPYVSGKIATITGSVQTGVFGILIFSCTGIVLYWIASRRASDGEAGKVAWATAAGEPATPQHPPLGFGSTVSTAAP